MTLFLRTARAAAFAASLGIVMPQAVWADGPREAKAPATKTTAKPTAKSTKKATTVDIALSKNGTLDGAVVASDGTPLDGTLVSLRSGETVIATTTTDDEGRYSLTGVTGGVYQLSAGANQAAVRAWAADTAPPTALQNAIMVAPAVRGQGEYADEGGGAGFMPGVGFLDLVIVGAAGGALAFGVINHNDNNKLKKQLNKLITP